MDDINNAADFVGTTAGTMGYKVVETATGRVGQIINAGQIITNDHPVESGFAFGVGTSTGIIVGDSMFRLLSRSGSNPRFIPVIAVAWVSVYTADNVNDFIKGSLEKFRIEQEQQQKQQIQEK